MNTVYDIAIIGLGPAGSTFARLLENSGYSVVAIDKKNENVNSFRKPCGGLFSEDAQRFFSKFGLTMPLELLVDPQIFSVKTIDLNTKYIKYYQRFYINVDRHKFDLWLKSLIPSYVEIIDNSICTEIKKMDNFYNIKVFKENKEYTIKTKYIIGADGANSIVRKTFFPDKKISSYLAIQQWFEDKHDKPFYSCIFDKTLTDCYCWGVSKNNKFILGGAFPFKNGRKNFEILKNKLTKFGFKSDIPIKTEACIVLRPNNPFEFCYGKDNVFLIGEAAGFISPSSLEGISYAFESAYILSKIFNQNKITINEYKKAVISVRLKLLLKLLKNPFLFNPYLRYIVMKSGIQSINVI